MSFLSRAGWSNLAGVIFAVYAAAVAVYAQQAPASGPSAAELLKQLNSDQPIVRNGAVQQLHSDPSGLADPKIKIALVNLLDHENQAFSRDREEDDEGYAEYVGLLADTTAKVVDWNDQHQVCILADSWYLPDELADHARISVPCLMQRLKTIPHSLAGEVVAMMVQALSKGRNNLEPATVEAVRQATLSALHDPHPAVRIDTVRALGRFGSEDMIPALKVVAESDPAPEVQGHSVRKRALEAIAQIQKRAQAHN